MDFVIYLHGIRQVVQSAHTFGKISSIAALGLLSPFIIMNDCGSTSSNTSDALIPYESLVNLLPFLFHNSSPPVERLPETHFQGWLYGPSVLWLPSDALLEAASHTGVIQ